MEMYAGSLAEWQLTALASCSFLTLCLQVQTLRRRIADVRAPLSLPPDRWRPPPSHRRRIEARSVIFHAIL